MNVENHWEETDSDSPAESKETESKAEIAAAEILESELPEAESLEAQVAADEPETGGEQEEVETITLVASDETIHQEADLLAESTESTESTESEADIEQPEVLTEAAEDDAEQP